MVKIALANQEHQFIIEIKERVRKAQYEALKVVNTELISLYWDIGKAIVDNKSWDGEKQLSPSFPRSCRKNFQA